MHSPVVVKRADGTWEVVCEQCRAQSEDTPVGIGLRIADLQVAQSICDNHRDDTLRRRVAREILADSRLPPRRTA